MAKKRFCTSFFQVYQVIPNPSNPLYRPVLILIFTLVAMLCNSLFKWSLILQPKLILQPNLRYVNEIPLCERNLDFATEINHFATEMTILQPNWWIRFFFFGAPAGSPIQEDPHTPSSGEPYSLGAALRRKENWCQVPPWHQGIVGVKEWKEEIEVNRYLSHPLPRGHKS